MPNEWQVFKFHRAGSDAPDYGGVLDLFRGCTYDWTRLLPKLKEAGHDYIDIRWDRNAQYSGEWRSLSKPPLVLLRTATKDPNLYGPDGEPLNKPDPDAPLDQRQRWQGAIDRERAARRHTVSACVSHEVVGHAIDRFGIGYEERNLIMGLMWRTGSSGDRLPVPPGRGSNRWSDGGWTESPLEAFPYWCGRVFAPAFSYGHNHSVWKIDEERLPEFRAIVEGS